MLLVATYLWAPHPGTRTAANPYTADDVRLLQRMVARNLTVPHEFAVITDQPNLFAGDRSIRVVPMDASKHIHGTRFARLMTFRPDARDVLDDRVLQLDLDCVIVGNIDHLVSRGEDLVLWRNPERTATTPNEPIWNTSILLHRCGTKPEVWTSHVRGNGVMIQQFRDDNWWLSSRLGPDIPAFCEDDGIYRLAHKGRVGVWGDQPANASIVFFAGAGARPDNATVMAANPWIAEHRK